MSQSPTIEKIGDDSHILSLSVAAWLMGGALFVLSLFLPAFITQTQDINGFWVLAMGWMGFITFQFAWFAMPLAVISIRISRRNPQIALLLSVVAILVASEAFLFRNIPFDNAGEVLDVGLGFYFWYMSFILVAGGNLLRLVAWGRHLELVEEEKKAAEARKPQRRYQHPVRTESKVEKKVVPRTEAIFSEPVKPPPLPDTDPVPPPLPSLAKTVKPPPLPVAEVPGDNTVEFTAAPPPLPSEPAKLRAASVNH